MDTQKIRTILNTLFLIGAVVAVASYFLVEDRMTFIYICAAVLFIKVIEFIIRFTH
ncbi:MAG: hypothetical protein ACRC9P_04855 [Bacteroides sp.]